MTTNQGDSAVYKLGLKQAASLLSDNSYPIYTIFGSDGQCWIYSFAVVVNVGYGMCSDSQCWIYSCAVVVNVGYGMCSGGQWWICSCVDLVNGGYANVQ